MDGIYLTQSMSRLLSLLIDYRRELKYKLISANEVDDRLLMCTYTLLRFYRDEVNTPNRRSIMHRYIEKLAKMHQMLGNFTEAAFTLQLHCDTLEWYASNSHQPQDVAIKKEMLCETILNDFEQGKCWEEAIKVCKSLQKVYESSFKLAKLSAIMKRHASLLDNILTQPRAEHEYFRVTFYGLDFPGFLQNCTFIFRGLEFEKLPSFTHRIQQEFPNAQLLTKSVPSDENITESMCQCELDLCSRLS